MTIFINKKIEKKFLDGLYLLMDLETVEEWKPFPHPLFKDMHEVSNKGQVRNKITGHIRIPSLRGDYYGHTFHKNEKHFSYTIHSLVAQLFVPKPESVLKLEVNHIDTNKINNIHKNLEWITRSKNGQHAVDNGLVKINRLPLEQYDKKDNFIKSYESQTAAAKETGIDRRLISAACNGRIKTAGGFKWKSLVVNENRGQIIDLRSYKQIKSYPNYYVNQNGRIYNKFTSRFIKFKTRKPGQYARLYKKEKGKIRINKDILVHRVVALYFLKRTNKKLNGVRHKDGNKKNNNVKNLEWYCLPSMKNELNI